MLQDYHPLRLYQTYYKERNNTMYYITYKRTPSKTEPKRTPSIDYLVRNFHIINQLPAYPLDPIAKYMTYTSKTMTIPPQLIEAYCPPAAQQKLINLWESSKHMLVKDMSIHYHGFLHPKKSGGYRQIMAPNDELKGYLRTMVDIIQDDFHILYHDAAYAYTKGRSPIDAARKHQQNESQWFLKIDLKDFFPSCNYKMVNEALQQIFPICQLYKKKETKDAIEGLLKLCFINDALPQGTPTSPMLTNLLMLPLDFEIQNKFKSYEKSHFVYTRYADDIILSCVYNFNWRAVRDVLAEIINVNGFKINNDKTRYGNRNGRNWNLGLMLNKDNNITVGHKRKKELRAMIHNFLNDYHNETPWSKEATQIFLGQLSYATSIEPEYFHQIINMANVGRTHTLKKASLAILRS